MPTMKSVRPVPSRGLAPALRDYARWLLGLGGTILLLVGTWLPVLKLSGNVIGGDYSLLGGGPFMDQINASKDSLMQSFMTLGIILAVLAVATAVLVLLRIWVGLWATGGVALATVGYGFFSLTSKLSDAVKAAGTSGSAVSSAFQPGWGWAVLFVGAAMVLGAALLSQGDRR
jgi:hypothetical protein